MELFAVPGSSNASKGGKLRRKLVAALQKLPGRGDDGLVAATLSTRVSSAEKRHSVAR